MDIFMMPTLFNAFFILVISIIIIQLVRSLMQWQRNNASPVLSVAAKVVTKRLEVSHHNSGQAGGSHTSTRYYATFEVESGDRMELALSGKEYGQLVEGDLGKLTFQGTRFLAFELVR